jgi:hypothetical protein
VKFWVCCEVRANVHREYTGYALLVDWDTKEIVKRFDVPRVTHLDLTDDQAGKYSRGVRAMTEYEDKILALVAAGAFVLRKDDLKVLRVISNKHWQGGHFLQPNGDGTFWVNANIYDSLMRVDMNGEIKEEIRIPELPAIAEKLCLNARRPPVPHAKELTEERITELKCKEKIVDQMHLNSMQLLNGCVYAGSCLKTALMRLKPNPDVVFVAQGLDAPHDFTMLNGHILVNDSDHKVLALYDRETHRRLCEIWPPLLPTKHADVKAEAFWTRGLLPLDENRVLFGMAPLAVAEANIEERRVTKWMAFSQDIHHTCHGLSPHYEGSAS